MTVTKVSSAPYIYRFLLVLSVYIFKWYIGADLDPRDNIEVFIDKCPSSHFTGFIGSNTQYPRIKTLNGHVITESDEFNVLPIFTSMLKIYEHLEYGNISCSNNGCSEISMVKKSCIDLEKLAIDLSRIKSSDGSMIFGADDIQMLNSTILSTYIDGMSKTTNYYEVALNFCISAIFIFASDDW